MINDKLVKAIVLVTVMQSILIVGIEVRSYLKERFYIRKIQEAHFFYFDEEDEELDYKEVPEFNSKNTVTIA